MAENRLTIATRNSPLALAQTEQVQKQLKQLHPELAVEILPVTTQGDKFLAEPLYKIGGKALFLKELEQALMDQRECCGVTYASFLDSGLKLAHCYLFNRLV